MHPAMAASVHILVMISSLESANRRKLAGILRYARKHGNWEVRVSDTLFSRRVREDLRRWHPDAIIICEANIFDKMLFKNDGPVVVFDAPTARYAHLFRRLCFIQCDNNAIAEAAARHLLDVGFRSFAYLSPPADARQQWSTPRSQFFKKTVQHSGASFQGCLRPPYIEAISRLPHNTAVLAANDSVAQLVLSQCRVAGISVPDDIAFIGVDNDEIICDNTEPPLTSVEPDFYHAGYLAARTVSDMLNGEPSPQYLSYGVRRLVSRESSQFAVKMADERVRRAIEYIRQNALEPITVPDVARVMCLCRRMAELTFKHECGNSIAETIRDVRIDKLKHFLSETSEPIEAICLKMPYASVAHLKHLFKSMVGMTMSEWRAMPRGGSGSRRTPRG